MPIYVKDYYTEARYCMERLAKFHYDWYGTETIGMRFFSVYGPREEAKGKYANLVSQFLWCMKEGKSPVLYGDGTQKRDFIHVDDITNCQVNIPNHDSVYMPIVNVTVNNDFHNFKWNLFEFLHRVKGNRRKLHTLSIFCCDLQWFFTFPSTLQNDCQWVLLGWNRTARRSRKSQNHDSSFCWHTAFHMLLLCNNSRCSEGGVHKAVNVVGIVAEYNPFHNGHLYHMESARKITNCEAVVVAMSGSFCQRGEPAIIDKFSRAEAALQCGADLVLELPFCFAACQKSHPTCVRNSLRNIL